MSYQMLFYSFFPLCKSCPISLCNPLSLELSLLILPILISFIPRNLFLLPSKELQWVISVFLLIYKLFAHLSWRFRFKWFFVSARNEASIGNRIWPQIKIQIAVTQQFIHFNENPASLFHPNLDFLAEVPLFVQGTFWAFVLTNMLHFFATNLPCRRFHLCNVFSSKPYARARLSIFVNCFSLVTLPLHCYSRILWYDKIWAMYVFFLKIKARNWGIFVCFFRATLVRLMGLRSYDF